MKSRHLAWGAFALACTAHAQSSVTLYGLIDVGLTYVNNAQTARPASGPVGGSQFAMSDGSANGMAGSRWGLRVVEDLGGGLKTLAVLENGFWLNNGIVGQGGAMFGRQAFVGLSHASLGSLTFGRQYDTYTDFVQPLAATGQWAGYMGAMPDDVDSLSNTSRINNAIKYKTPSYNGFQAGVLYSLGGVADEFTQNQVWSLGASYSVRSLTLAAGYINARDPNVSLYGNTPNKGVATLNNLGSFGSAAAPQSYPVDAGYVSASTTQIAGAAIQYALDPVTLGFVVTNARFENLGSTSAPNPQHYTGSASFMNFEFSVKAQLTPAFMLASAFHYTDRNSVDGDGGARYLQLDLGTIYNFSKSTSVYLLAVMQKASGRDSLGQSAVASISGFSPSTSDHQIAFRLGLQKRF